MRHEMGYHFYHVIPVPLLTDDAMRRRVAFCREQLTREDFNLIPIIVTDESTICQDLNLGGIWRNRGEEVNDASYVKMAHEISVMIWGAISQGFRTKLLRCPERVDAISYMQMLADGQVFYQCIQKFGPAGFYWQQDNAPAHGPGGEIIEERFHMIH
jgi:hypothetical protein